MKFPPQKKLSPDYDLDHGPKRGEFSCTPWILLRFKFQFGLFWMSFGGKFSDICFFSNSFSPFVFSAPSRVFCAGARRQSSAMGGPAEPAASAVRESATIGGPRRLAGHYSCTLPNTSECFRLYGFCFYPWVRHGPGGKPADESVLELACRPAPARAHTFLSHSYCC